MTNKIILDKNDPNVSSCSAQLLAVFWLKLI